VPSSTNHPSTSLRRITGLTLLIFLSIALPVGIVWMSVILAMSDKPVAMTSFDQKYYGCSRIKNGELWFTAFRPLAKPVPYLSQIKRLDLKTGIERDEGRIIANEVFFPLWVNDDLYAYSWQGSIYKWVDSSFVKLNIGWFRSPTFSANLFVWNSQLTKIVETPDGAFRLFHLQDDEWVEGRQFLLPEPGRVWYDDLQRGRKKLLPRTSGQPAPSASLPKTLWLRVKSSGQQIHIFIPNLNGLVAYRNGFEFADDQEECASALAPENSAREVSGWEAVPHGLNGDNRIGIAAIGGDPEGLLMSVESNNGTRRFTRRNLDGQWESLVDLRGLNRAGLIEFVTDPADGTFYVIEEFPESNSAVISRIEGNRILPPDLTLTGDVPGYLARWRSLFLGILLACLTHWGLLTCVIPYLARGNPGSLFETGIRQAALASAWRRAFARSVDTLLILSIIALFPYLLLQDIGIGWQASDQRNLCHFLLEVEQATLGGPPGGRELTSPWRSPPIERYVERIVSHPEFISYIIATMLVVGSLKVSVEGRFGTTPGKWLLGIRTMNSMLRPCGFASALVREVLFWGEILFFITPVPAVISMMLSTDRQRLGDRVTDTIVVNARSIRTEQKHIQSGTHAESGAAQATGYSDASTNLSADLSV